MRKIEWLTVIVVASFALFWASGLRFAVDGSGWWPRFFTRKPNFDALEANRAQQRAQPLPSPPAPAETTVPEAATSQLLRASAAPVRGPADFTGRLRGFWPEFRGVNRDGRYEETPIRTAWPAQGLPGLWKQPIGLGYASFAVAGGRAFTIEQRRNQEIVAAYDVETGREVWTHGWDGAFSESMGGDGPRATPTYHDGRVYALGALGELRCLDAASGALVWRRNILTDNEAANLSWGMAASPLIVDDTVVVLPGGDDGKSVVAYHKNTGEPVWKALSDRQAYTSPMLVTLGGVRQILIVTAKRALGLTVDGAHVLWEHPWVTDMAISVAQPLLVGGDRIFLSAGYGHGAAVFEVTRAGDQFTTRTVWQNTRMKNKFSSSVLHQGYIYGLDEAILGCVDVATGEQKWKGGRYGYGQIMIAGDSILVLTEDGDLVLVKAVPNRHEELARFSAISGKTWNPPVVASGRLLIRNGQEMAAFDIRPNK